MRCSAMSPRKQLLTAPKYATWSWYVDDISQSLSVGDTSSLESRGDMLAILPFGSAVYLSTTGVEVCGSVSSAG